ncbi:Gfo/Idh/MocA family protein [Ureibacillus chungkukjangi]|uniref:Gfo/Idh/MocA family protein n=1 Tax=Ureibacillus chungkukjangi TaxID=1202712 RepID=UPI00203D3F9A|nr:Gfo/Idh/MocA family oxidoreductase [Ureibacillus chungkukjangi]
MRIGILGASDIAFRRFLPALQKNSFFEYTCVAIANFEERNVTKFGDVQYFVSEKSIEKAENFKDTFNGTIYNSYEELLSSDNIDAVYIPLPPALHYHWAKKALENGKHVLLEKPSTTNLEDTKNLLKIAKQKKLAIHENYAFCYHGQVQKIREIIASGEIGEVRQIRTAFGFPYRGSSDFRYDQSLGGGALLDCGGYPVKLSTMLLGNESQITTASLNMARGHNVDLFGSATLQNHEGITSHISFGMDNFYKCELEIWGSNGYLLAPRIFTAPANLKVTLFLNNGQEKVLEVPEDDQFLGSLNHFSNCITDEATRLNTYSEIEIQSQHVHDIFIKSQNGVFNR